MSASVRLMIVVASVRPGRIGLPIAEWVRRQTDAREGFEVDFVDLAELALPFMDEPNHPRMHSYTKPHTLAWSERVAAADAFLFVTPEYNYSYAPALGNALSFLNQEWWMKPFGAVSYGGMSSGTRGVAALLPVTTALGLVRVGANVELNFASLRIDESGFHANDREEALLGRELDELASLAPALAQARRDLA